MDNRNEKKSELEQSLTGIRDLDKYILSFLDAKNLQNFRLVSKSANQLVNDLLDKQLFSNAQKVNQLLLDMPEDLVPKFREFFQKQKSYEDLKHKVEKTPKKLTGDEYACFFIMRKIEDNNLLQNLHLTRQECERMNETIEKREESISQKKSKKSYLISYGSVIPRLISLGRYLIYLHVKNESNQSITQTDSVANKIFNHCISDSKFMNFSGMNLQNINLADDQRVYLVKSNFVQTNLSNANLYRAGLSSTDLTNANLSNARLEQTILIGAKIQGANFTNAKFINTIFLSDAAYSNGDKLKTELDYWASQIENFSPEQKFVLSTAIFDDLITRIDHSLTPNIKHKTPNIKHNIDLGLDIAIELLEKARMNDIFSHQKPKSNSMFSKTPPSKKELLDKRINVLEKERNKKPVNLP